MARSDKYELYLRDLGILIKEYAQEAREERAAHEGDEEEIYHAGEVVAYGRIISLMQQQAKIFGIAPEDLQLEDVNVEKDLLTTREETVSSR